MNACFHRWLRRVTAGTLQSLPLAAAHAVAAPRSRRDSRSLVHSRSFTFTLTSHVHAPRSRPTFTFTPRSRHIHAETALPRVWIDRFTSAPRPTRPSRVRLGPCSTRPTRPTAERKRRAFLFGPVDIEVSTTESRPWRTHADHSGPSLAQHADHTTAHPRRPQRPIPGTPTPPTEIPARGSCPRNGLHSDDFDSVQ